MQHILNVLNKLKYTRSKKEKIRILKTHLNGTDIFKDIVVYALNEDLQYGVKTLPLLIEKPYEIEMGFTATKLFEYLDFLSSKLGCTDAEKKELAMFGANDATREIITRIINKDLRCGVGARLVNEAMPDLLKITPYQRCSTMKKIHKINFPAYNQRKADTQFGYYHIHDIKPFMTTRKGKEFEFPDNFLLTSILSSISMRLDNYVLLGELQVYKENSFEIEDRQTGNGIIGKALKGTMSPDEEKRIFYEVWDIISETDFKRGKCNIPYDERLEFLKQGIDETVQLKIMPSIIVHSIAEVQKATDNWIKKGYEGTITKDMKVKWSDGTSSFMIKGKAEHTCEMQIIEVLYGKKGTKNEHCIGKFICQSEEGEIIGRPGTGFSDKQRGIIGWDDEENPIVRDDMKEYMNSFIGDIISVTFNEITKDKKTKQETLYLPRIDEFRTDRAEADTAKYIRGL